MFLPLFPKALSQEEITIHMDFFTAAVCLIVTDAGLKSNPPRDLLEKGLGPTCFLKAVF